MLLFRRPSDAAVRSFLDAQREAPYSYASQGATRDGALRGFRRDHHRVRLGDGDRCFDQAVRALSAWRMFDLGWVELHPDGASTAPGTVVAVLVRWNGLWFLNACRVVYGIDEISPVRRSGFAYGTLVEHAESGEERFTIERREDGSVWYDILALSRPHQWVARVGHPFTRALQKRFARDSMVVMEAACVGS